MIDSNQVNKAFKWSFITEIIVKFISPITNMILARLLTPSEFGIVASLVMITTFADMFTDAGFQKYIVQHQFSSKIEQDKYVSVAFFSNCAISLFFYILIFVFADIFAKLTGIDGYGNVLRIYSIILFLTSFSSIQFAIYRKRFEFKKLGLIRITVKFIPLIVTVPLAFLTHSFWAIVIGNLIGEAITAICLMCFSEQKIKFFYDFKYLKKMFTFCSGSLLEVTSSWLVSNISIFIIGQYLGNYYLGLYKTSITTVNQIVSIITASTMNVLFATLSKQQKDNLSFNKTVQNFQKNIGILTVPLGVGIFVYRDFITSILLGSQWKEASIFLGLWGFVMCESVIFADVGAYSIVSKGKPFYVFLSNMIQAILLSIFLYLFRDYGFIYISIISFCIRWQLTITHYFFAIKFAKIGTIPNQITTYFLSSLIMGLFGYMILINFNGLLIKIISIVVSIIIYFSILMLVPNTKIILKNYFNIIKNKLRCKTNENNYVR